MPGAKRGASHVETILSFVIFVSALVFALIFFAPTNTTRLVDTSLVYLFKEIQKNATTQIETFSVKIYNETIIADEERPPRRDISTIALDIRDVNRRLRALVKTLDGVVLNSSRQGNLIYIRSHLPDRWRNIDFIRIAFGDEFPDGNVQPNVNHEGSYYQLGSSNILSFVSERKIKELNKSYYADYFGLKDQFNIPERVNFGFSLYFGEGDFILSEREIPRGSDVFSDTKRIEVIRENSGEIKFADLSIKVW